ncbi:MAG: ABC transporter permease [Gemmatimonadales bacterium]
MPLREAFRLALQTIWAHKMKSVFAVIGVFIGVTFLIAVVTIVEGMNSYMTDRFAGELLGVNTFHLRRLPDFQDTDRETWRRWRRRPPITYEDAEAVVAAISVPITWAWESDRDTDVSFESRVASGVRAIATTEDYFEVKGWDLAAGRPFSAQEARAGLPVAVIGQELAEKLFEGQDPVGREITIRRLPYRVVGVVESQGNLFGISLDKFVVAPALSPLKRHVNRPKVIDALIVKTANGKDLEVAMAEAEAIMRVRRRLRPNEENAFALETADAVLDFWGQINQILMVALPGLVSISLVVGGIVIMNIMLMSVAERTREIGIRKSLGARRRDILRQFLVESATLATLGAAIGIMFGLSLAGVVEATTFMPARVAPWSIGVAVLLGAGVGIGAGLYPASRAARLDPVDAMRHE